MICSHCQTKNPGEAKFCMNCGKPMPKSCTQCGQVNSPSANFCIKCGHDFSRPYDPQTDTMMRVMPRDFAQKIETARIHRTMQGERRIVTILFCDIKGSTAMAERLDPEEWAEIMNEAFEYLISPIYKYEGTLARLMGDSILAFFGAPITHEDDAQRAVLAGMDILEGIQPFREKVERRYGLDFNLRVGINTGLVVVGDIGSDLFMEYTALGDAINIASRMEQTALPGTIQIAEDTYKKVRPFFEFEQVEGLEIKGKTQPVDVYRVIRQKDTPGRRRGIQGMEAPLIGRTEEFAKLDRILLEVGQGRGQILSLIGDAGLGKTRVLKEASQLWESRLPDLPPLGSIPSRWNQVAGISYESSTPYRLIQKLIRNFIGVTFMDEPEVVRKGLVDCFSLSGVPFSKEVQNLFEILLGVKESTNGRQIEGEELKKAFYKHLLEMLGNLAQQGPTVIAVDDLHWSDQASADFLIHLFQLANSLPILFLCSFRPDRASPAWLVKQNAETSYAHRYSEINLMPLSAQESHELVDRLLNQTIPAEVQKLILEKTDGNPFFVEEVIRTLFDRFDSEGDQEATFKVDSLTIPDNLQTLLAAKIDQLEDKTRRTLQIASVIGRSFNQQVLAKISDTSSELDNELNTLQRLGLILEVAREPYPEYIFRQALTQETAYFTILLKNRRAYHRKVGEALLQLYGERVEEFAALLGYHFYHAQDERALQFFKIEGDAAFRLYANQEAITYYSQAIEVALWHEKPDMDELVELYQCRGRSFELNSQFTEALENYAEMQELGARHGDEAIVLKALIAQAQMLSIPSDQFNLEVGLDLLNKAQKMAEEQNDRASLAKTYWIMTNLYRFHVNLKEAQQVGEKAISLARELGLEEQLAYSLTDVAHTYNMDGRVDRAREVSLEAVELWKKLGNQPMLADAIGGLVMINTLSGDFDQAYKYSDEAYDISLKIENLWGQAYSRGSIGLIDFERGDVDLAISHIKQSHKDAINSKFLAGVVLTSSFLAVIYAELGSYELAVNTMDDLVYIPQGKTDISKMFHLGALLLTYAKTGRIKEAEQVQEAEKRILEKMNFFAQQHYLLALCYLTFEKGDYEGAIQACQSALDNLQETGVQLYTPELLLLVGKSHLALGSMEEAQAAFIEARDAAEWLGSQRNLWQVYYYLGICENQRGNPAGAASYFSKSRVTLQYILSKISNQEIKDNFLDRAEVKGVLATTVEKVV